MTNNSGNRELRRAGRVSAIYNNGNYRVKSTEDREMNNSSKRPISGNY